MFDGYFEQNLGPWDVAAGALLVREAGGVVTDWQGDEQAWLTSGDIVAAPPAMHERILELIAAAGAATSRSRPPGGSDLPEPRGPVAERGVHRVGDVGASGVRRRSGSAGRCTRAPSRVDVGIDKPTRRRHPAVPEGAPPGARRVKSTATPRPNGRAVPNTRIAEVVAVHRAHRLDRARFEQRSVRSRAVTRRSAPSSRAGPAHPAARLDLGDVPRLVVQEVDPVRQPC